MTQAPVLRDIHLPGQPSWWPPAPGWWLLAALAAIALVLIWRAWAGRRHRARLQRALHDELVALRSERPGAAAQVAAMSLLLRRAAKRYAPHALTLRDQAWLEFLDGDDGARPFSQGAGRLLLDGPYRRDLDPAEAEALAALIERRLVAFVSPRSRRRVALHDAPQRDSRPLASPSKGANDEQARA